MALRWAAQLAGGLARVGARSVAPATESVSSRLLSGAAVRGPAASAATELRARAGSAASAPARGYVSLDYVNAEGETIEQIRSRIFGNHIGDGQRSGRKVLRRGLIGQRLVEYYPKDLSAADPFMLSLKAEKAKLKLDRLKRRGKGPPKKGSGKRSKK